MAERWVSKLEATSLFKVTERTLDNWVKSGKMQKARHKGQIMYEISIILEEKAASEAQFEAFSANTDQKAPNTPTPASIPEEEEEPKVNIEEKVLLARLDEKNNQISMLTETLEKRQKDLNTLVMERGSISEKSNQLLIETEMLRKEREALQKEKEDISEKHIRKTKAFYVSISLFAAIFSISAVLLWKYNDDKNRLEIDSSEAKALAKKLEVRVVETETEAKRLAKEKEMLAEKASEAKQKEALALQKASEASERISEIKKDKENLQKELENAHKIYSEQQKEIQDLKLKVKVNEVIEQNKSLDKSYNKQSSKEKPEKTVEKPIEKTMDNAENLTPKGTD